MPRHMNRRNNWIASKNFVDKRIEEEKWSRQYITNFDLSNVTVNGGLGDYYDLTRRLIENAITDGVFLFAPVDTGTDNNKIAHIEVKLDYLKWRIRVATGESEVASAVSQTVRIVFYRSKDTHIEQETNGFSTMTDDVDGSWRYDLCYGNKFGLYSDKMQYVHSWAADSDTTAGGQVIFKGFKKLKFRDSWTADPNVSDQANVDNENGSLDMLIVGDDPTGTNSTCYGFVEIGWRYKI